MSKLLFVLLFLLPFVVLPFGTSQFEAGKVLVGEILIMALVLGVLRTQSFDKKHIFSIPSVFLIVIFLLSVVHLLLYNPYQVFFGNAFRMQGVFLLWTFLLFAFFSSGVRLPKFPGWVIPLLLFLQLLAAMFLNVTKDGRGVGTLGEPNSLAGYAVFLWPFLFFSSSFWRASKSERLQNPKNSRDSGRASLARMTKKYILRILGTILTVVIILFSGSRSGIIAFGIEVIFVGCLLLLRLSVLKSFLIAFCLFLIALVLPFFQTATVYENRAEIWQTAVYAGYEHSVIGWGFGNTETAFKEYNEKLYNRLRGYYVDSSHNIFLDMWVQGGFIGLASFVALIYYAIRIFLREKSSQVLCVFLGLITVLSFNPVSAGLLIPFWWVIGKSLNKSENGHI